MADIHKVFDEKRMTATKITFSHFFTGFENERKGENKIRGRDKMVNLVQ